MDAHRASLRRAYDEGRAEHPTLSLDLDRYAETVLALVQRRYARLTLEPTAARVREAIVTCVAPDLYLATACEVGVPGAWDTLHRLYLGRLTGLALRRGAGGLDGETLAGELLGALALPPPRGEARTLLGTYDGAGTLFSWLAVSLVRRVAGHARGRRTVALAGGEDLSRADARRGVRPPPDPADGVLDDETAVRFEEALGAALAELTPQERLALLLKYRDGLSQRQAAPILGVGEPRVSRLVAQALERFTKGLRALVKHALAGRGAGAEGLWEALRGSVERRLASFPAAGPQPSAEGRHDAT